MRFFLRNISIFFGAVLLCGVLFFASTTQAATCACVLSIYSDCSQVFVQDEDNATICAKRCKYAFGSDLQSAQFETGHGGASLVLSTTCSNDHLAAIQERAKHEALVYGPEPKNDEIVFSRPVLNIDIPGISFTEPRMKNGILETNLLGEYLSGVYTYLLQITVVIAIVMLMIGGLQYTVGAAQSEQVEKGKTRIKNAVTGLALLFTTYLILHEVNPRTNLLQTIQLETIREIPLDLIAMENTNEGYESFTGTATAAFGSVPLYKQSGAPWGQSAYGRLPVCPGGKGTGEKPPTCSPSYAYTGCGPTSLAMVLSNYGKQVDPKIAGEFAFETGAHGNAGGTNGKLFANVSQKWPDIKSVLISQKQALKILQSDKPLPIVSGTPNIPGCYKRGGHWIVFTGVDQGGLVRVNDPATGRCFDGRDSSDGYFGEKGAGLTGMSMRNFKSLGYFWLVAPIATVDDLDL